MKSKKVLAILLSMAIMLTFMPTMSFAAVGDPDELTKCTYTVSDGSTLNANSIEEAMAKVVDNGTVTAEGTINNTIEIGTGTAFNLDLRNAVLTEGVEVTTLSASACLVNKNGLYVYHDAHNYNSADATASKNTEWGNVTVYCEYGHTYSRVSSAQGTRDASLSTDEVDVYKINSGYNGVEKIFRECDQLPNTSAMRAIIGAVTWEVKKSEQPDNYVVTKVDYVKDGKGVAVKDAEGKVQFFAKYTKNGSPELDENDKEKTLPGTITKVTSVQKATTQVKGISRYEVEFTLPNDTKYVCSDKTGADRAAIEVTDEYELAEGYRQVLKNVQFMEQAADAEKASWGTLVSWTDNTTPVSIPADVVLGDDGSFTYRLVWSEADGGADINDESATSTVKAAGTTGGSEFKACGKAIYRYESVSKKITRKDGTIVTSVVKFADKVIEGKHDPLKPAWASDFEVNTPATHNSVGYAEATCEGCGKVYNTTTGLLEIPKTDDHNFEQENDADKIYTVDPTCIDYGFKYKKCKDSDNGWTEENLPNGAKRWVYVLKLDDKENGKTYKFTDREKFKFGSTYGHPVLVGSVTDKIDHKYYVVNADPTWGFDATTTSGTDYENTAKVELTQRCMLEGEGADKQTYVYHQLTFAKAKKLDDYKEWKLDEGSTDTVSDSTYTKGNVHVFGAITPKITEGKDCKTQNKVLYTVNGITKSDGTTPVTHEITSQFYGSHTYNYTVTFSKDGKTASVTQQCTFCSESDGHSDKDGNIRKQSKQAVVTSNDNEDGSTTYTATLEGVELTNNTKTVFDLDKAVVTFNEGEELDINTLTTGYADAVKKLVKVTINGAEIDSKLYKTNIETLLAGVNNFTVTAANNVTNVVGLANGIAKCYKLKQLLNSGLTVMDGDVDVTTKLVGTAYTKDYDGNTVTASVDKVVVPNTSGQATTTEVTDATVKYAVATKAEADAKDFDSSKLSYGDKAEVVNADEYNVYAEISKEGYTTIYPQIATIKIKKVDVTVSIDNFTMRQGETPDVNIVVTAGIGTSATSTIVDADPDEFEILSAGGQALPDLIPGDYKLLVVSDNYTVATAFAEGRVGTVTVLTKDGKTPEQDAKDAAAAADKALEAGNKITTEGYTADSVKAVQDAQAALNAAIASGSIDQVKAATAALNDAVNKAVAKTKSKVKVAKKTFKVKAKNKKAAKTTKFKKALKAKKAAGTVTFKKANKKGGSKIVVKSDGTVIVKKGLKKGTYKVAVKATDAGNDTTLKTTVKGSFTVKVK